MRTKHTWSALLIVAAALVPARAAEVRLVHHPRQTSPSHAGHPRLLVEDPEAHKGTAQAALPGKSVPGSVICSFYSYARPAGIYKVTWRIKVDDNTIDEPVFKASTGGGSITVKGTDFEKADAYEDFSYTAEKGEGGFFGVSSSWPGKGRVYVDRITVTSEELFTDEILVERAGGLALPDFWVMPPPAPVRLHIAKGLWWDFFGISEAAGEMGGAVATSSYHGQGQWGSRLRGYPRGWQHMMQHNVVVLANVDARALGPAGRLLLKQFVMNGGGLLVTGGPYAFGRGGYANTAIEDILPCSMPGKNRNKADGGLLMQPAAQAADTLPRDLAWSLRPRVYYIHDLEPKPDARVLVTAGDKPLVIASTIGKGRVVAIAATAEGDPPADELPFWEWGDMPRLTAALCRWLATAPREAQRHVIDEKSRQALDRLAVPSPGDEEGERQRVLAGLLAKCRDRAFARELVLAVSTFERNPDRRFVEGVASAVRPFVDQTFAAEAVSLLDSGSSGKASLGLRLLALTGSDKAEAQILRFLREGADALTDTAVMDLFADDAASGLSSTDIVAGERLKLSAVLALGDLGDAKHIPALRNTTTIFSRKRQQFTEVNDQPDLNENIYQQSLAARCRLGDATAVGPLLDALLKNADEIEQFQNALDVMLKNEDDKVLMHTIKVAHIRLPTLHSRQAFCLDMLSRFPYSVAGELARQLVKRDEPALTPFAFAALSPNEARRPNADVGRALLPLLSDGNIRELRLLAFRIAADTGDPELGREVTGTLSQMAASEDPASALFALRRLPRIPPAARRGIIDAASKHPDASVQRLARLSEPLLR